MSQTKPNTKPNIFPFRSKAQCQFAIYSDCNHVFCLNCIRKCRIEATWRKMDKTLDLLEHKPSCHYKCRHVDQNDCLFNIDGFTDIGICLFK